MSSVSQRATCDTRARLLRREFLNRHRLLPWQSSESRRSCPLTTDAALRWGLGDSASGGASSCPGPASPDAAASVPAGGALGQAAGLPVPQAAGQWEAGPSTPPGPGSFKSLSLGAGPARGPWTNLGRLPLLARVFSIGKYAFRRSLSTATRRIAHSLRLPACQ